MRLLTDHEKLVLPDLVQDIKGTDYSSLVSLLLDGPRIVLSEDLNGWISLPSAVKAGVAVDLEPEKSRRKRYALSDLLMEEAAAAAKAIAEINGGFPKLADANYHDVPSWVSERVKRAILEEFPVPPDKLNPVLWSGYLMSRGGSSDLHRNPFFARIIFRKKTRYALTLDAIELRARVAERKRSLLERYGAEWEKEKEKRRGAALINKIENAPAKDRYAAYLAGNHASLVHLGLNGENIARLRRAKKAEVVTRLRKADISRKDVAALLGSSVADVANHHKPVSRRRYLWATADVFEDVAALLGELSRSELCAMRSAIDALVEATAIQGD